MKRREPFLVCAEFDAEGNRISPWRKADQADAWARRAEGVAVRKWLRSIVPGVTSVGWKQVGPDDVFVDVDRASIESGLRWRFREQARILERFGKAKPAPIITRDGAVLDEAVAWIDEHWEPLPEARAIETVEIPEHVTI